MLSMKLVIIIIMIMLKIKSEIGMHIITEQYYGLWSMDVNVMVSVIE